jgi:hypothetical protein
VCGSCGLGSVLSIGMDGSIECPRGENRVRRYYILYRLRSILTLDTYRVDIDIGLYLGILVRLYIIWRGAAASARAAFSS